MRGSTRFPRDLRDYWLNGCWRAYRLLLAWSLDSEGPRRAGPGRTSVVTRLLRHQTPLLFFGVPRPSSRGSQSPSASPALGGGATRPGQWFKESLLCVRPFTPRRPLLSSWRAWPIPHQNLTTAVAKANAPKKQLWAVDHSAHASMKSAASCVT